MQSHAEIMFSRTLPSIQEYSRVHKSKILKKFKNIQEHLGIRMNSEHNTRQPDAVRNMNGI